MMPTEDYASENQSKPIQSTLYTAGLWGRRFIPFSTPCLPPQSQSLATLNSSLAYTQNHRDREYKRLRRAYTLTSSKVCGSANLLLDLSLNIPQNYPLDSS
ncbi:hypothetical protein KQX54_007206 [Cotesia glomerata]|uniref:Uncharacterized protein n=1 Tax=Cotesia glomerata TaxID=32391 RepID=A0AAV7J3G9_COTGL|nr:hypothetical protein KQX54_007206 [Cotesia glomerata]